MAAQGVLRVTTLRSFLSTGTALSETTNGTAFDVAPASSGLTVYTGLHLTSCSAVSWVFKLQSASSSGMGAASDRVTFAAQTCSGAQWATPITMPAAPAEARWWRSVATPASTTDVRLGLIWVSIV